ncbi:MAG: NADAR family protein [Saprospiraceae bacterium]|nr:NADAR family protein [Saprospiraceae bacterium]
MDNQKEVKFYRVNDKFGCFSNFSNHSIFYKGTFWKTSEHAFQGQKFADFENRYAVICAKTPMEAAQIGRERNRPLRSDWEEVKDEIMKEIVWAKVMQHSEVREKLLSTGNAIIIEHTKNDNYWADGGDGSGKNMLGKILMEIRVELNKNGSFDELRDMQLPPWEKHPELDRYSIGWRMGYGEEYMLIWYTWYRGLSTTGKEKYKKQYIETVEWIGFYKQTEEE